jgi:hypothetical protein
MSIDRFCLVDDKKIYHWMICTEIVEDLQRNGGSSWGNHSVYVMQGGVEYPTRTLRTPRPTSRSGVVSQSKTSRSPSTASSSLGEGCP